MATFEIISSQTVSGSSTSEVTFSSIPQTYTDLCLRFNARTIQGVTDDAGYISINQTGYQTTNYTGTVLQHYTTTTTYAQNSSIYFVAPGNNATASTFGASEVYFSQYTTSGRKLAVIDSISDFGQANIYSHYGCFAKVDTNPITSISILVNGTNYADGSKFFLYGISNA